MSIAAERAALLEACLGWMRPHFDAAAALLRHPPPERGRAGIPGHVVRESLWYATGLLATGAETPTAIRIVDTVLDLQFDEPGAAWDGTWPRAPQDPHPRMGAVMWRDYDPNWRQFIGCLLGVLARDFAQPLGAARCERVRVAIARALRGEGDERIVATYSNIALMQAWLAVEFGDAAASARGVELARAVDAAYRRDGGFAEFNSPTYYGVDLWGLALWRRAHDRTLVELGAALEAELWRDIAQFHHGGLRNLCGPYDRAYGMDMTRYAALLGLWLWWACGDAGRAFPNVTAPFGHALDVCAAPLLAVATPTLPDAVVPRLLDPAPVRSIARRVGSRSVTAAMTADWMLGAVDRAAFDPTGQARPATAHWRDPTGGVGWLSIRGELAGTVTDATIEVRADAPLSIGWRAGADDAFDSRRWTLGGRRIAVAGCAVSDVAVRAERGSAVLTLPRGIARIRFD